MPEFIKHVSWHFSLVCSVDHVYQQSMIGKFHGSSAVWDLQMLCMHKPKTTENKLSDGIYTLVVTNLVELFIAVRYWSCSVEELVSSKNLNLDKLLENESFKLKHYICFFYCRPFHRALVTMLVHSSWKLRRSSHQTLKKLLAGAGSSEMMQVLLEEFRLVLTAQKVAWFGLLSRIQCVMYPKSVILLFPVFVMFRHLKLWNINLYIQLLHAAKLGVLN